MSRSDESPIGVYEYLDYHEFGEVFRPYDDRAPNVALQVADLIRGRMPDAQVEHVGSTAIPGCPGKGIIDLMLMYASGRLAAARDALDSLGFQRQTGAAPFPEERPMRVGTIDYDGESFRLHVHVIASDDPEACEHLYFRDRLRADVALRDEYVESKRAALADLDVRRNGRAHNIVYNEGKAPFIRRVLAEMDTLSGAGQKGS